MSLKERGWELVQIKAFTSWLNGYLEKRGMKIEDIKHDLNDGIKLINFLELLSGKTIKQRYDNKPASRIQKIQNLHIALTFLEKEMSIRITNMGVGAEDFADDNLKIILGFFWTLFKKFRIQTIKQDDKSSEEGLLLWVKKTTEGYDGVNIENYRNSFRSGNAFLALCDAFIENPEVFDYNKFDRSDPNTTLAKAYELAEAHLGIPKLLDPEETSSGEVDERSLVLYISLYFHAFVARQQQRAIAEDKNRLEQELGGLKGSLQERAQKAEELNRENQKLKQELEQLKQENAELREKNTYLEEKVEVLKQLLEQENEEKEELEKAKQELEKQLQELRHLVESQAKEIAQLKADLEEERKKNKELSDLKLSMAETASGLDGQIAELTSKLQAETSARKKEREEQEARARVEVSGLDVLKKNLDEHIEDLHRWQRYLDIDTTGEVDFVGEIRPAIMNEISQANFDEQLKTLSSKLAKENEELVNLLKAKEAEQKARKNQEKKKKDRQKKSEN
jgi:cortexillin 1/2